MAGVARIAPKGPLERGYNDYIYLDYCWLFIVVVTIYAYEATICYLVTKQQFVTSYE